jgi:hypothetical protein
MLYLDEDTEELKVRLGKDLQAAAEVMSVQEVRYLVNSYYSMQEIRKRSANQLRAMGEQPHKVIEFLATRSNHLELSIKTALDSYGKKQPVGQWLRAQKGIGPVLTAGLLAHLSIYITDKSKPRVEGEAPTLMPCATVGHWWAFAGYDPRRKWGEGEKRPWNAELKVLCYKIGASFVKVSGREDAVYGQAYRHRKDYETSKNERGEYAGEAERALNEKSYARDTKAKSCYVQGKLPPGHLDARARRWAVKLFLSHLHQVWYTHEFGCPPPKPYAVAHLGHAHFVSPPGPQVPPKASLSIAAE